MTERVQKPIPKPRKKPPSADNCVDPLIHLGPEQSTSDVVVEQEILPIPILNKPIGWDISVTERFSATSSSTSLSSSLSSPIAPPQSMESSVDGKSIYPSLFLESPQPKDISESSPPPIPPPPKLPPHFTLPLGPPPPIPPRTAQEKPLPLPIEDPLPSPAFSDATSRTENDENIENDYSGRTFDSTSLSSDKVEKSSNDSYWPPAQIGTSNDIESHDKELLPVFSKSNNIHNNARAEGEAICLCGWVLLKQGKKDFRRLWASIRQRQLLFMATDEVSLLYVYMFLK